MTNITTPTTAVINQALLPRIKPSGKRFDVRDKQLKGFHLRVGASGVITYALQYRNAEGKQRKVTIGRTTHWTPSNARKEAVRLLGEVVGGRDPAKERREARESQAKGRTLKAVLEGEFWELYQSTRKTGKAMQQRIKRTWSPFMGQDIATITSNQLSAHRVRRLKDGTKPQTLNRDRSALFSLFVFALEHGIIDSNPLATKTMRRLQTEKDERVRYLGQRDKDESYALGERARFTAALDRQSPFIQAIVGLAMSTGMRRGEIFSLTWNKVDLTRRRITISAASTKSNTTRQVPLNDNAIDVLKVYKQSQGNVIQFSGLVFPSPQTSKRLVSIQSSWIRIVKNSQLTDFKFHDLRHDYASRLVQANVPLYHVSKLLGHTNLSMTQRYAHLDDESLLAAAKKAELCFPGTLFEQGSVE